MGWSSFIAPSYENGRPVIGCDACLMRIYPAIDGGFLHDFLPDGKVGMNAVNPYGGWFIKRNQYVFTHPVDTYMNWSSWQ
ncbi:hypothetical protein AA23498_2806 [Acetobacter nitrogenifigens DSM 23921 = NBRC 105050]|nr:hypothetical protein AA23498_2806 [Acetobacter nitrogenifigens DSM 23921 = NBRC 105050]